MKRIRLHSLWLIPLACLTLGGWLLTNQAQTPQSNYRLSGPYAHKNLTIFLIHGADQAAGKSYLTLQEAMKAKKVVVHETRNINELSIENVSAEEVYVQAGDIVKGGQQDRVLSYDLIVPPRSGRIPINAFCVEQGRWQGRGNESVVAFSVSEKSLNSKELKLAAKRSQSQNEVWAKVAEAQQKLSRNVAAEVAAPASRSSLQLTLENPQINATAQEYQKALAAIVGKQTDVIGYAFAINGKLNSADVYGTSALFRKLWPKLLEASAVEAIAELDQRQPAKTVTASTVKAALDDAEAGKPAASKDVTNRVRLLTRETNKHVFFETRDQQRGSAWVHRNYVTKE
jgi:hypothetical protein